MNSQAWVAVFGIIATSSLTFLLFLLRRHLSFVDAIEKKVNSIESNFISANEISEIIRQTKRDIMNEMREDCKEKHEGVEERLEDGEKLFNKVDHAISKLNQSMDNGFKGMERSMDASRKAQTIVAQTIIKICEGSGIDCENVKLLARKLDDKALEAI